MSRCVLDRGPCGFTLRPPFFICQKPTCLCATSLCSWNAPLRRSQSYVLSLPLPLLESRPFLGCYFSKEAVLPQDGNGIIGFLFPLAVFLHGSNVPLWLPPDSQSSTMVLCSACIRGESVALGRPPLLGLLHTFVFPRKVSPCPLWTLCRSFVHPSGSQFCCITLLLRAQHLRCRYGA